MPTRVGKIFVSLIETLKMEERNSHIDELIAVFLSRGLDKEAREELEAWISASEDNRRYFMQQQEIWFSAVQEERMRYDADQAFEAFRQRVAEHRTPKQPKRVIGWKSVFKYAAAVLVVGLVSFFSYQKGESNLKEALTQVEVEAPLGAQTRLRLPDGTLVVLNAGSRLVYPQDFGVDNREVELSGEGYFEVARNEEAPFEVQTRELNLRVLGTKFNLKNYADDKEVVVSLMEGRVALQNEVKAMPEVHLVPEEQVLLNKKTGEMRKLKTSVTHANCWKDNKLFFDEELLEDIAKKLMRSYAVQINVADSLHDRRFYGDFVIGKSSIREVLDAIAATGRVNYTYKEGKYILY